MHGCIRDRGLVMMMSALAQSVQVRVESGKRVHAAQRPCCKGGLGVL